MLHPDFSSPNYVGGLYFLVFPSRNPPCVRRSHRLSFPSNLADTYERRGGRREPGIEERKREKERETNGEETGRSSAGGIDPCQTLSPSEGGRAPWGWRRGGGDVTDVRKKGGSWSWQSRPTHTSPCLDRRESIYDRGAYTTLLISLSIAFWSSKHLLTASLSEMAKSGLQSVAACCESKRWPITVGQMVGRD